MKCINIKCEHSDVTEGDRTLQGHGCRIIPSMHLNFCKHYIPEIEEIEEIELSNDTDDILSITRKLNKIIKEVNKINKILGNT